MGEGFASGLDGDLGLEDVLAGLDNQGVDAAVEQAAHLLEVGGEHDVVAELAEGDQLGSGADGAGDEAGPVGGAEGGGGFAGDLGGGEIEGIGVVLEAEFGEDDAVGAEGVGFDEVGADVEEVAVDAFDGVGAGLGDDFDAVFEAGVVAEGQVEGVDGGSHGAVADEDALAEGMEKAGVVLGHIDLCGRTLPARRRGRACDGTQSEYYKLFAKLGNPHGYWELRTHDDGHHRTVIPV